MSSRWAEHSALIRNHRECHKNACILVFFCYDEIKVMLPVEVAWRKLIKRKDTMPSKNQIKKQKTGFTIIEVVLVLAIAGLIFLMVFVALPALQRSQRDTQRRQDYADLSANIINYKTSNGGKLPGTGALNAKQFLNTEGKDPNGTDYNLQVKAATSATKNGSGLDAVSVGKVFVYTSADCSSKSSTDIAKGFSVPTYVNNTNAFAVFGYLESGTYCQASQ